MGHHLKEICQGVARRLHPVLVQSSAGDGCPAGLRRASSGAGMKGESEFRVSRDETHDCCSHRMVRLELGEEGQAEAQERSGAHVICL
ncbi:hypothetical protein GCM10008956_30550 [Deinococcus arenae]|uniref:Uncharacterized protein n=1 Tax=Deinococcus arenae TaxID=1452751 RepID=A0A8H9GRW9_9DEIO|nr:hypothetical protein GCM10008956_30550 [Deinococcus arenae]